MSTTETKIPTDAELLAAYEQQIAQAAALPTLAERRRAAKNHASWTAENAKRFSVEATRAAQFLSHEEGISQKVAASVRSLRFGINRLVSAAGGGSAFVTIDSCIATSEYLARTSSAKITSRKLSLEKANKAAAAASAEHKLALADLDSAERELAAAAELNGSGNPVTNLL